MSEQQAFSALEAPLGAQQRDDIRYELVRLNNKIQSLQQSEDERLARELQAIELDIQQAKKHVVSTAAGCRPSSLTSSRPRKTWLVQLAAGHRARHPAGQERRGEYSGWLQAIELDIQHAKKDVVSTTAGQNECG